MTYVEGTKDPAEMWTILEGRYKPKTRVTLRQLQRQFNTIKMTDDDGDMEKHLQKIERLKRQIEEQGERIPENHQNSVFQISRWELNIKIRKTKKEKTKEMAQLAKD